MLFEKIWTQSVLLWLKHIESKITTAFTKFTDVPDFSNVLQNSDFWPFWSKNSQSGHIFDALKFNDIAAPTLHLSFTTKIKALSVLVYVYDKF